MIAKVFYVTKCYLYATLASQVTPQVDLAGCCFVLYARVKRNIVKSLRSLSTMNATQLMRKELLAIPIPVGENQC